MYIESERGLHDLCLLILRTKFRFTSCQSTHPIVVGDFFLLEGEISVGESFFSLSYDDDEFSLSIKHKLKVYLLIRVPDYKQHSNWIS